MSVPSPAAIITEIRRLTRGNGADPASGSALRQSIIVEAASASTLGPLDAIEKGATSRLVEWSEACVAAPVEVERRWREAVAAELASYAIDPIGYLRENCEPFVAELGLAFEVDRRHVPTLLDLFHRATGSVRRGILIGLAASGRSETASELAVAIAELDCDRVDPHRATRNLLQIMPWSRSGSMSVNKRVTDARLPSWFHEAAKRDGRSAFPDHPDSGGLHRQLANLSRGSSRRAASGSLRLRLSRYLDDPARANRFIADAGAERAQHWPRLREDGQSVAIPAPRSAAEVAVLARALAETDPRIGSLTLASASALEAGDLDTVDAITRHGLSLHGTLGRGAELALNRALAERERGRWTAARLCYSQALQSRVERYRCFAVAAASLAAMDFDDSASAVLFCDRGLAESPTTMHRAFRLVAAQRQRRGADRAGSSAVDALRAALRSTGRSPQRILGGES